MKKFGLGLLKATFIYGGAIGGAMLAQIILNKVGGTKIEPLEEGSENEEFHDIVFQDEEEA
jgi:hypothetical protein